MEQKLNELKSEVESLLKEHQEGIKVNSFWGLYERKYRKLPEPKVFRVRQRSQILDLCREVYRTVGSGAAAVIHLRPADHCSQQQQHASPVAQTAAAAGESEPMQSQSYQFAAGGSFYQRFYAESESDKPSDSIAEAGPGSHNITWSAPPRSSYTSLMAAHSRPAAAAEQLSARASLLGPAPRLNQFAVPSASLTSNTSTARPAAAAVQSSAPSSLLGPVSRHIQFATPSAPLTGNTSTAFTQQYQTPRSRDSSASRSSDGARNVSPATAGRHYQPHAVPITPLVTGRSSTPAAPGLMTAPAAPGLMRGVTAGRGRRANYSSEQLNSAAEDCIDRLSMAKEYVSLERISHLLCNDFNVASLDELGLRQIDDLRCVNEHKRVECKVNAYIQNFVKVCWLLSFSV